MYLRKLGITKIRNLQNTQLEFNKEKTFFFGENAQGKTNILEAIYLLCIAKSFRTRDDSELIPFDDKEFLLHGVFSEDVGITHRISMFFTPAKGKKIQLDGKNVERFSQLIGLIPIVTLTSNDYAITNGPPSNRRKFFDILLSQSSAKYLITLKEYERILKQRNSILASHEQKKPELIKLLSVWNDQLIDKGSEVIKERNRIVKEVNEHLVNFYQTITKGSNILSVQYQPNIQFQDDSSIEENFSKSITKILNKEIAFGTTLIGPNRDEYVFRINERNVRQFGSRGEHKSALLSLKIAEAKLLLQKTKTQPILLLDDFYAELDKERGQNAMSLFSPQSQYFITGTTFDYEVINSSLFRDQMAIYFVKNGSVISQ